MKLWQHLNHYINTYLHKECDKAIFIRCFIVTAETLIWPVIFLLFCSWRPAEEYLFATLRYITKTIREVSIQDS